MAKPKSKFLNRLSKIAGIKNYILVRQDGEIMTHNFEEENPETISSILLFTTLNCEKIKAGFGFRNLKYLTVSKENNENLFIFPLDKYFLGIMQHPTVDSIDLLKELSAFVNAIVSTKENIS